jgi:PAS domain-containing protein
MSSSQSAPPTRTVTIGRALLPYALSLAMMAVPVIITIFFSGYFRTHPTFAPVVSILYLLAMIGSAWWGGYIAGVVVVISCVLISTYVGLGRLSLHDIPALGISAFILIAVLVSSVAASRRRTEQILRSANEQLEIKVRERTAELERAKTWLQITLASIGDAVIATDKDGRVAFLNGVAEAMTGWSQPEASGRPLTDVFVIVNETTRAAAADPVARVLQTGAIAGLANHTVLISRMAGKFPSMIAPPRFGTRTIQ